MSPAATSSEVDDVFDETRDETKADPCPPKADTDVTDKAVKNAAIFMVMCFPLGFLWPNQFDRFARLVEIGSDSRALRLCWRESCCLVVSTITSSNSTVVNRN